jgi:hypothetical protein
MVGNHRLAENHIINENSIHQKTHGFNRGLVNYIGKNKKLFFIYYLSVPILWKILPTTNTKQQTINNY